MSQAAPFKRYDRIFEEEAAQAVEELGRPARGLFISGVVAGVGIGLGALLSAALLTRMGGGPTTTMDHLLIANAQSAGFVVVIMARADLFTEYSTITVLPVLTGQAPVRALLRLWALVYAGNLLGGACFAATLVAVGPALGSVSQPALAALAGPLIDHSWQVVVGSAALTGWLMGLLSWLVIAARESISQAFFIWLVTMTIGLGGLHHTISGGIEVLVSALSSPEVGAADLLWFFGFTTTGNVLGGVLFAVLMRYSVLLREETRATGGSRDG